MLQVRERSGLVSLTSAISYMLFGISGARLTGQRDRVQIMAACTRWSLIQNFPQLRPVACRGGGDIEFNPAYSGGSL